MEIDWVNYMRSKMSINAIYYLIGTFREFQNLVDLKNKISSIVKTKECATMLWQKLGDIPINENEEIDEDFLHFSKGCDKSDVWHWVEDFFNVSIVKDLMYK